MTGLARSRPGADTKGRAGMVLVTSACRVSVSQLQEVVDRADHRPFASDFVEAPQQELPEASGICPNTGSTICLRHRWRRPAD
jgi:hypothetical protein